MRVPKSVGVCHTVQYPPTQHSSEESLTMLWRRRAFLSCISRSAFGLKSLPSDSISPSSSSPSVVYFFGGTVRSLILSLVLLGVTKVLSSSRYASMSDSSVSLASSKIENERRLRDLVAAAVERTLVVSGVGRPLSALSLLTGVAKIGAPGAVRLTPLVAVADRRAPNGPIFAILRMMNKRSLIARAVGLVGPSPASRQKDCVWRRILARTHTTLRRLSHSRP